MRKKFKLNDRQNISIPSNHPIYKEVLAAVLANQDLDDTLDDTLWDLGYCWCGSHWHYDKEDSVIHPLIILSTNL